MQRGTALGASLLLLLAGFLHFSCSKSGGGTSGSRVVTLSWTANRESGVNGPGGGYRVSISGAPAVDVPYVTGPYAPTSTDVTLAPGTYTVTVSASAALDAQGGTTGSASAPSQAITLTVP